MILCTPTNAGPPFLLVNRPLPTEVISGDSDSYPLPHPRLVGRKSFRKDRPGFPSPGNEGFDLLTGVCVIGTHLCRGGIGRDLRLCPGGHQEEGSQEEDAGEGAGKDQLHPAIPDNWTEVSVLAAVRCSAK